MNERRARLAKRLWGRAPGRRYRFWFGPEHAAGLQLEPVTEAGTEAYRALRAEVKGAPGPSFAGVAGVGPDERLVFVGADAGSALLTALATWSTSEVAGCPALAALQGATAVAAAVDLRDDGAVAAVDLDAATGRSALPAGAWSALARPTLEGVGAVLAGLLPGERAWAFVPAGGELPLVAQRVADDPNREWIAAAATGRGAWGLVVPGADGRLSLVGDLAPGAAVAVAARAAGLPGGWRRLADCRGVGIGADGRVDTLEGGAAGDRGAWPGTLAEAAAVLAGLEPGAEAWAWIAPAGPHGPHLALHRAADDPDGTGLRARERALAGVHGPGVRGAVRRLADGSAVLLVAGRARGIEEALAALSAAGVSEELARVRVGSVDGATLVG